MHPAPDVVIRRALPSEAERLSALALRSKAHWGYDRDFLEQVRPILTFSKEDITRFPVYVLTLQDDDEPAGMYRLTGEPPQGELEDLWLDPRIIGRGLGRLLFKHALSTAADEGFQALLIEADPNAAGFYRAMGAIRVGSRRSSAGRTLPLLRINAMP